MKRISLSEEQIAHRRKQIQSKPVPTETKPIKRISLERMCKTLGFWASRKRITANTGLVMSTALFDYSWGCGCTAMASDGQILQMHYCEQHESEEDK
jgi:hypothetical protein